MTQHTSTDAYGWDNWDGSPVAETSEPYRDETCPNDGAKIDFPAQHIPGAGLAANRGDHTMNGHCPVCGTHYQLEINDNGPTYLRQAQADGYLRVIRSW